MVHEALLFSILLHTAGLFCDLQPHMISPFNSIKVGDFLPVEAFRYKMYAWKMFLADSVAW